MTPAVENMMRLAVEQAHRNAYRLGLGRGVLLGVAAAAVLVAPAVVAWLVLR